MPTIDAKQRLTSDEVREVTAIVDAATDADGVLPLSEHVLLHLRYGGDHADRNFLFRDEAGTLVGYAHLDSTDVVEGSSAELVVHPQHRRLGYARELARALVESSPDGRLRLWAHGEHPAAAALATGMGFKRARVLRQMRRSLLAPIPAAELPPGIELRTFVPGQDEDEWLALNNRAFAAHPEQGKWTLDDLRGRECEPWFDPAGFFLAIRDGKMVGFHWTKVHGSDPANPEQGQHGHEPIGEVYVVGVDPSAQGLGLGQVLTIVGLRHLRARGLAQVMLYVDGTNTAAIRLYERLGFREWDVDVSYART